jgi:serine/threonine-protein kinase
MGEVEIAVRVEGAFRRTVAIKRLRKAYANDGQVRRMFLEEARVAGLLHHPNIVSVIDFGEDERGPFLVMDYVEGMSLVRLIQWARGRGEMLPVQLCCRIARQVAEGLHAAHELRDHRGRSLSVVHRDVSPQNILISYDGVARLTDFGIARALGRRTETDSGILKGKMGYMSPEQLRYEDADRRSDLFALGVVLWELLAARRLYQAERGVEVAQKILHDPAPDIHEIRKDAPPRLVDLLFRLLTKDREHRPSDARAVSKALEGIIAELVEEEPPQELVGYLRDHFEEERDERREEMARLFEEAATTVPGAKRGKLWPLAAVGTALGVGGALLALWATGVLGSGEPEPPPPAPEPVAATEEATTETVPPAPEVDPDDLEPMESDAGQNAAEERTDRPRRRRRRRAMRRRQGMMGSEMEGELWGWR